MFKVKILKKVQTKTKNNEQENNEQQKIEFQKRLASCNRKPENKKTENEMEVMRVRIIENKEVTGVPFMCG